MSGTTVARLRALARSQRFDRIGSGRPPRWKEAGSRGEVGSMLVGAQDPAVLELLAEEML